MAAINKTMPKIEISGPTGACSYPLLKELFQPSYQPNHQNKHAGNVSTQVFVIARRPIQKFCRKEWTKAPTNRAADLQPCLISGAESSRAGVLRSAGRVFSRKFCCRNQLGQ